MMGSQPDSAIRVLYVDHVAYVGGAEISLIGLVRMLKAKGSVQPVMVVPTDGPLVETLSALGIEVRILRMIPLNLTRNPVTLVRYVMNLSRFTCELIRLIKLEKIDLVHANSIKAGILAGAAARLARVPMVWHIRDFYPDGWIRRLVKFWGTRFAVRIIAISHAVAGMFNNRGDVTTIHNGVDLDLFAPFALQEGRALLRSELGLSSDVKLVGMIGQLAPWKGQVVFLKAAEQIIQDYPHVHFVLVGDVYHDDLIPYRDRLRKLAQERLPDGSFSFIGWRNDIVAVMAAIDVLIHPARGEAFGRVIIEAMAAGKPVVAVRSGALPEIVEDKRSGFLVPVDDSHAMANAIVHLLRDPNTCIAMGKRGRSRVEQLFSLTVHSDHVLQEYHLVLSRSTV
jgi:glycosyltransferase involved in cell wall biosynthesis